MFATELIVEVVGKTGTVQTHKRELEVPQTLCDVHNTLWRKISRKPAICMLSGDTARVVFQEGRRVEDTLDSLQDLVRIALEGGW